MTVCAARHDEPGFFTPCVVACALARLRGLPR